MPQWPLCGISSWRLTLQCPAAEETSSASKKHRRRIIEIKQKSELLIMASAHLREDTMHVLCFITARLLQSLRAILHTLSEVLYVPPFAYNCPCAFSIVAPTLDKTYWIKKHLTQVPSPDILTDVTDWMVAKYDYGRERILMSRTFSSNLLQSTEASEAQIVVKPVLELLVAILREQIAAFEAFAACDMACQWRYLELESRVVSIVANLKIARAHSRNVCRLQICGHNLRVWLYSTYPTSENKVVISSKVACCSPFYDLRK